jgi:hypothetical protein
MRFQSRGAVLVGTVLLSVAVAAAVAFGPLASASSTDAPSGHLDVVVRTAPPSGEARPLRGRLELRSFDERAKLSIDAATLQLSEIRRYRVPSGPYALRWVPAPDPAETPANPVLRSPRVVSVVAGGVTRLEVSVTPAFSELSRSRDDR